MYHSRGTLSEVLTVPKFLGLDNRELGHRAVHRHAES
jgi:hypothetical protein